MFFIFLFLLPSPDENQEFGFVVVSLLFWYLFYRAKKKGSGAQKKILKIGESHFLFVLLLFSPSQFDPPLFLRCFFCALLLTRQKKMDENLFFCACFASFMFISECRLHFPSMLHFTEIKFTLKSTKCIFVMRETFIKFYAGVRVRINQY